MPPVGVEWPTALVHEHQWHANGPVTRPASGEGSRRRRHRRPVGVRQRRSNFQNFAPLHAVSGKSGRVLWSADLAVRSIHRPALLTASDLDGDGLPEVIFAALMDWGDQQRTVWSNQSGRLWLFVLSGRRGLVRWKSPLTADRQLVNHDLDELSFGPAVADLNGDGVRDIVVPAQSGDAVQENVQLVLRALDGSRGEMLWEHALPAALEKYRPFRGVPPPLIADLDGDGVVEIYSLEFEGQAESHGVQTKIARLQALECRRWPAALGLANRRRLGREARRFKRQMAKSARGARIAPVRARQPGLPQSLGRRGRACVARRTRTDRLSHKGRPSARGVSGLDRRFDRRRCGRAVVHRRTDAAGGRADNWFRRLAAAAEERCGRLGVGSSGGRARPGNCHRSRAVARVAGLRFGRGDGQASLDVPWPPAKNGRRIDGPAAGQRTEPASRRRATHPSIYLRFGDRWLAGPRDGPQRASHARPRLALRDSAPRNDPRLVRPLPWWPPDNSGRRQGAVCRELEAVFFCLAFIVLPGATVWWMVSRRRFGLRTLAFLPFVAALFVTALLIDMPDRHFSRY